MFTYAKSQIFYYFLSSIILFMPLGVRAFDWVPEYQGISETELEKFETPMDLNSEHQTIWNAYLTPLEWERDWLERDKIFNFSLGSISNNYFLHYSRAKFATFLNDDLKFIFIILNQRDLESDQARQIIEFQQNINQQFKIAVYGEPSLYKRENDLGVALLFEPTVSIKNRIYFTAHDWTRKGHNNEADHFVKNKSPYSWGWSGSKLNEKSWWSGGFRMDTSTEWYRPQEQRIFEYEKKLAYLAMQNSIDAERQISIQIQWDEVLKGERPDSPSSTVIDSSWLRQKTFVRLSYKVGSEESKINFEPSLTAVNRNWKKAGSRKINHRDIQPSVVARLRSVRRADKFDHWQFGFEVTSFHKSDPDNVTLNTQKDSPLEARMNAGYQFSLQNNSSISLGLNFDLDDWHKVPTFEGGSGQVNVHF